MEQAVTTSRDESGNVIPYALREAGYAALISFGLFVLLIGLKTDQNIRNELILVPRWGLLAIIVAITAIGRFVYVAYAAPYVEASRRAAAQRKVQVAPVEKGFIRRNFNVIGLVALFLYPVVIVALFGVQGSLKWVDNFGIQVLIYVMLAWGLNIVVGLAGLLDLGYVAFYAVGAYAYALLGTHFGLSFWILLPAAGIMAAMWGVMLGFPVLRLRGDYLAIVTLAFGEIIRLVLINWREVTNGSAGIAGIPEGHLLRVDVVRRFGRQLYRQGARHRRVGCLLQDIPLLPDRAALPAHCLRDGQAAALADRPRLGGAARG